MFFPIMLCLFLHAMMIISSEFCIPYFTKSGHEHKALNFVK